MSKEELLKKLEALAEEANKINPQAAVVLFSLCAAVERGEEIALVLPAFAYSARLVHEEERLRLGQLAGRANWLRPSRKVEA